MDSKDDEGEEKIGGYGSSKTWRREKKNTDDETPCTGKEREGKARTESSTNDDDAQVRLKKKG